MDDNKDNTFSINLSPVNVNNTEFNNQMDIFDDEISQLIVQNNLEQQQYIDNRELPSMNPPVKPITFIKDFKDYLIQPIVFTDTKKLG